MAEWNCFLCKEFQSGTACTFCDDGSEFVRMTNADRIRSMTDEELALFLIGFKNTFGTEFEGEMSCLDWLKAEVKEGE